MSVPSDASCAQNSAPNPLDAPVTSARFHFAVEVDAMTQGYKPIAKGFLPNSFFGFAPMRIRAQERLHKVQGCGKQFGSGEFLRWARRVCSALHRGTRLERVDLPQRFVRSGKTSVDDSICYGRYVDGRSPGLASSGPASRRA